MSRIRSRNTTPELALRQAMYAAGLRYRCHWRVAEAKVNIDIASPSRHIAIFIDGCFWHGCPLHAVRPRTRSDFWDEKLTGNRERDLRQTAALMALGWNVIRLWEHEVDDLREPLERIVRAWNRPDHIPAIRSADT